MRGAIDGLETPHPLCAALPAMYQEDDFTQRFLAAFDEVLAPVICTLDNLEAYFDPETAPEDFLAWLGSWVGISFGAGWPLDRRREALRRSFELYEWQGTARGLAGQIALYTGAEPEVVDSGGCVWSPTPGGEPPGDATPTVTVRVRSSDAQLDTRTLEAIVAATKPAHVSHRIEVLT